MVIKIFFRLESHKNHLDAILIYRAAMLINVS